MWDGRDGSRQSCGSLLPSLMRFGWSVLLLCAAALLLTVPGCSWGSSTQVVPTLPVLPSLQRLELNGTPGVWMNSDDAGSLAVWIYDVTGEEGLW